MLYYLCIQKLYLYSSRYLNSILFFHSSFFNRMYLHKSPITVFKNESCLRNALFSFCFPSSCVAVVVVVFDNFKKGNRKDMLNSFVLFLVAVEQNEKKSKSIIPSRFYHVFYLERKFFEQQQQRQKKWHSDAWKFLFPVMNFQFPLSQIFQSFFYFIRGYNEKDINWISVLLSAIDFDGNFHPRCWIALSFIFHSIFS